MVIASFLTPNENDAVALAEMLYQKKLLLFDTIENHEDLIWDEGKPKRRNLTHLSGFTKSLLYRTVEKSAFDFLGDKLVRMWSEPVTNLDPKSTQQLMTWLAKV